MVSKLFPIFFGMIYIFFFVVFFSFILRFSILLEAATFSLFVGGNPELPRAMVRERKIAFNQ